MQLRHEHHEDYHESTQNHGKNNIPHREQGQRDKSKRGKFASMLNYWRQIILSDPSLPAEASTPSTPTGCIMLEKRRWIYVN